MKHAWPNLRVSLDVAMAREVKARVPVCSGRQRMCWYHNVKPATALRR